MESATPGGPGPQGLHSPKVPTTPGPQPLGGSPSDRGLTGMHCCLGQKTGQSQPCPAIQSFLISSQRPPWKNPAPWCLPHSSHNSPYLISTASAIVLWAQSAQSWLPCSTRVIASTNSPTTLVLLSCHFIPGLPWALASEGCPGPVTAEQGPFSHVSKDSSRSVPRAQLTSLSPGLRGAVGGLSVVATWVQQCGW